MTHYARNNGRMGLQSSSGPRSDLIDRRKGAYDNVAPKPKHPIREHGTEPQEVQPGSAVQPRTEPSDQSVPEGLRRLPKDPLNPHAGRGGVPSHVPSWKPKKWCRDPFRSRPNGHLTEGPAPRH
jgi:hypothetical protein